MLYEILLVCLYWFVIKENITLKCGMQGYDGLRVNYAQYKTNPEHM
jgi:hypothetical protein